MGNIEEALQRLGDYKCEGQISLEEYMEEKNMKRECNKCVYHTSGSCSRWMCKGTTTIQDIQRQAVEDYKAKEAKNGGIR